EEEGHARCLEGSTLVDWFVGLRPPPRLECVVRQPGEVPGIPRSLDPELAAHAHALPPDLDRAGEVAGTRERHPDIRREIAEGVQPAVLALELAGQLDVGEGVPHVTGTDLRLGSM